MATSRYVNTFFWDDPYIEELSLEGKLLFLYLITTPLTNIAGSFEITIKKMHDHTGIDRTVILGLLQAFEAAGKVFYRDGWMLMINTIQHQTFTNAKIRAGIMTIVQESPQWAVDRLCIAYTWLMDSPSHLIKSNSIELEEGETPVAAVAAVTSTPVERRIWTDGVELLKLSGMKDPRPLLGRLAKEHGEERLAECIAVTQAKNPADPKAFLVATLKARSPNSNGSYVGKSEDAGDWQPTSCPCVWVDAPDDPRALGGKVLVKCEEHREMAA